MTGWATLRIGVYHAKSGGGIACPFGIVWVRTVRPKKKWDLPEMLSRRFFWIKRGLIDCAITDLKSGIVWHLKIALLEKFLDMP